MDIIFDTIRTTLASFDFSLVVVINVATYVIIKLIDEINGPATVGTWGKRVVFIFCSVIFALVYYALHIEPKLILNSIIIAPVSWSWIFKPLCKNFKIDYKHITDDTTLS